jgi:hypothetical protein
MNKIIVSNLMRAKNKQSFFALHQIQSKIKKIHPDAVIEFHILWDSDNELNLQSEKQWSDLIDSEIKNLYSYDKEFFNQYVKDTYNLDYDKEFSTWKAIYFILMGHYLRHVKSYEYYLIYDDDILINDDFSHVYNIITRQQPLLISEPANANCDKVLFDKLHKLFGTEFYNRYSQRNPNFYGFNAGFQGIDLSIYDIFSDNDSFKILLDLFEYKSIYDENGEEIWDSRRYFIDTQQQSFMSLLNIVASQQNPHILNVNEYFVVPNFGFHPVHGQLDPNDEPDGGWRWGLQSKITHFIGHTRGKGKPKQFLDKVDEYLKLNNFL